MSDDQITEIKNITASNTRAIQALTENVAALSNEMVDLKQSVESVLAGNEITKGIILEMRETREHDREQFEQHQEEFKQHQATTNKALDMLSAILEKLTDTESLDLLTQCGFCSELALFILAVIADVEVAQ